ncbi:MAG TPA: amidohydrolase family protein [Pirellulales bacterium]|nr:amidohydrolase family protein [Pirellulales bacterium]
MPTLRFLTFGLAWLAAVPAWAVPDTAPRPGLRENTPNIHALRGARVVVAPGQVIESCTLVIRDGVIEAVGADAEAPADARVWDESGKTIYAGFIDAFGELSLDASRPAADGKGAGYWNSRIVPQTNADDRYALDAEMNRKLRSQGIAARLVVPSFGIVKGTSVLVATGDEPGTRSILKPRVALHLMLSPSRDGEGYPLSPMGALALVRQMFYDARWYGQAWDAFDRERGLPRPERNDALAALQSFAAGKSPVMIQAPDELYFLRAKRIAEEFGLPCIIKGSGREYRRLEAIRATELPVVVPLDFPKAPAVATPEVAMSVSMERLMHWDLAPENPGRLDAAGVKIALTTHGLSDAGGFLAAVRKAVERGLKPDSALRALTTAPAELFGVNQRLGTLEAGKSASLVVADGDLFDKKTKILETWVDGRRYEVETPPLVDLRGTWELRLAKPDGGTETLTVQIEGDPGKLSGKIQRGDKECPLTSIALDGAQFAASFKAQPLGWEGVIQVTGTVAGGTEQNPAELTWLGFLVWADGGKSSCSARRTTPLKPAAEAKPADADKPEAKPAKDGAEPPQAKNDQDKEKQEKEKQAIFPVNYPLGAFGVSEPPEQPDAVWFEHATVWTCGPHGMLNDASVLLRAGKIAYVGPRMKMPDDDALVIDCAGKHLTPGIIDCHTHIATDGGVNEQGQTITAEVRIGDFVDPNDVNLYRQLAGGVTTANILHGSANTIGGQNQVIKFRWGSLPEELKFADAPPGIKFALGENVKQSNWGDRFTTRYPQTRMGVEQLVRDAFQAARDYRRRWDEWHEKPSGLPPRTDLELEALSEVLAGKRLIHCHSYRQDEILALLRTCEEFGVKIATLQHILEGYKLADAIAKHGAGASSFSDWWAFKFEVYDAIPYNGALMHNAGVVVSFNSDDPELACRLNTEAAKAVKYGGVPEQDALRFVTLNPAKQLGIDRWVGSIEVDKDADLALWSGPPLSTLTRCEQTWIDGRKYFDRATDRQMRANAATRRAALIQRILSSGEPTAGPDDDRREPWPREDVFCPHDHGDETIEE